MDEKNGGEARDWRKSRPIRVIRTEKGAKHSRYAPEEGIRYDGLYKVSTCNVILSTIFFLTPEMCRRIVVIKSEGG